MPKHEEEYEPEKMGTSIYFVSLINDKEIYEFAKHMAYFEHGVEDPDIKKGEEEKKYLVIKSGNTTYNFNQYLGGIGSRGSIQHNYRTIDGSDIINGESSKNPIYYYDSVFNIENGYMSGDIIFSGLSNEELLLKKVESMNYFNSNVDIGKPYAYSLSYNIEYEKDNLNYVTFEESEGDRIERYINLPKIFTEGDKNYLGLSIRIKVPEYEEGFKNYNGENYKYRYRLNDVEKYIHTLSIPPIIRTYWGDGTQKSSDWLIDSKDGKVYKGTNAFLSLLDGAEITLTAIRTDHNFATNFLGESSSSMAFNLSSNYAWIVSGINYMIGKDRYRFLEEEDSVHRNISRGGFVCINTSMGPGVTGSNINPNHFIKEIIDNRAIVCNKDGNWITDSTTASGYKEYKAEDYEGKDLVVVGLMKGCLPFMMDLIKNIFELV